MSECPAGGTEVLRAGRWLPANPRALVVAVALVLPFYADAFWMQVGLFAFAAAVAALGLNLLVGEAGQLSLAHSFFVAIGAYGYTALAAPPDAAGDGPMSLDLPPLLALVLAVGLAGAAGLAFTPIAARLRGIYLGVASLGLVFLGQHLLANLDHVTGGFNGRNVPAFTLPGITFDDQPGVTLEVLGVPFTRAEKLWYLGLAVLVVVWWLHRNLRTSRVGRAFHAVRDNQIAASAMGVHVTGAKASAFVVSSMVAGLGGVLLALAFERIVPETFGVLLAIEYVAMVVIGGAGSVNGPVAGAVFVSALPAVLQHYSGSLPVIEESAAGGGITAGVAARIAYGLAIVAVLLAEPGGLAALGRRVAGLRARRAAAPLAATAAPVSEDVLADADPVGRPTADASP